MKEKKLAFQTNAKLRRATWSAKDAQRPSTWSSISCISSKNTAKNCPWAQWGAHCAMRISQKMVGKNTFSNPRTSVAEIPDDATVKSRFWASTHFKLTNTSNSKSIEIYIIVCKTAFDITKKKGKNSLLIIITKIIRCFFSTPSRKKVQNWTAGVTSEILME